MCIWLAAGAWTCSTRDGSTLVKKEEERGVKIRVNENGRHLSRIVDGRVDASTRFTAGRRVGVLSSR